MDNAVLAEENSGKSRKMRIFSSHLLFFIIAAIFVISGIFLKINIIYSISIIGLLIAGLALRAEFIGFFSLLPFSYAVWEVKAISLGDIFLFSLGFVSSFAYALQFSVSRGKEANPFFSYGAGILLAAPYILFSALQYKVFSSSLIVSPLGVILAIFIIIFFRFQYYIWKGK